MKEICKNIASCHFTAATSFFSLLLLNNFIIIYIESECLNMKILNFYEAESSQLARDKLDDIINDADDLSTRALLIAAPLALMTESGEEVENIR